MNTLVLSEVFSNLEPLRVRGRESVPAIDINSLFERDGRKGR